VFKQVLIEKYKVFIDASFEVQLWSKWNYVTNMYSQSINSSIVKNLCQAKQEKHMNKKKLNINMVQRLWQKLNQGRTDQVLSLYIGYLWMQLDHMKKVFKEWAYEKH
jgi:hypothetical protein